MTAWSDNIKPKWGDQEDFDDYESLGAHEITTEETPQEDGSITKTVVEYTTNDKGQKVKRIKKIREYKTKIKINKRVEERRNWKKFGECAGARGPEKGITSYADEIFIDRVRKEGDDSEEKQETKKGKDAAINLGIVCRNCGIVGDHWTLKCPYFKDSTQGGRMGGPGGEAEQSIRSPGSSALGPSKYIPPSMRGKVGAAGAAPDTGSGRGDFGGRVARDETATIRVTNLSEDTKEADLSELFRPFGPISRIYLAKDKISGLSKGFAFINFVHREDAAKAITKLDGFGYDNLILHIEWAKPSNK